MNENKIIENIIEKSQMKIAVSEFKKEEKTMPKMNKITKSVATILVVLGLGTGVVFATTNLYEKIWKEPKSYTEEEMINELPPAEVTEEEMINELPPAEVTEEEMINELPPAEVTEEEKKELISEDEAKAKGLEILEKLGYENQTINRIELKRGYDEDVNSYYMVKTKWGYEEGLMVQLNAKGGDFIAFNDMDLKYRHLDSQVLDDKEIAKVATDIYNKLGIEEGKYTLSKTSAQDYCFENQTNKLLGANFYKYYDGIANKNESFSVSFMYDNGKIYLNSILIGTDNTYQNNPVVITEEEAINIAKNKEQELSPHEITNITSSLSIEKMNAFIYQLENDKYDVTGTMEDETYYKTENITRKVWKVKIEHNVEWKDYMDHNQYVKEGMGKIYFIDATAGEIIGGTHTYFEE